MCDHADPITTFEECFICAEKLRLALNRMADLDFGPKDAMTLIRKIREVATA